MSAPDVAQQVKERFGDAVTDIVEFRGEASVFVKIESLREIATWLKTEAGFDYLIDISSLDHFGASPRFEMVYEFYTMARGIHLRLRSVMADDDQPVAPTISDLWPTADWHEREVFDMMGVRFDGHKDLRRILMWDGYPYFPLRKDFPLQGKVSDLEEVAFTEVAPLAGGPFVTVPTEGTTQVREPRARRAGDEPIHDKFLAEP